MKKKLLIVGIVLIVFIIISFVIYKIGTHNELGRKVVISEITLSDAKVYKKHDKYFVDVNIKSSKKTNIKSIDIILYDKKGDLISTVNTEVGNIDKKVKVTGKTDEDISKSYSINYVVNRE